MLILDLVNNCNNYAIANLFNIIQRAFNILQILVPIIAILALALHVVKSVTKPDDKKNFSRYKNWIIALVIIFALPTIVDTVMNMLGENYSISACWNYAAQVDTSGQTSTYNSSSEGNKSSIVTDPSDYDPATGTSLDDSSSSSSSSTSSSTGTTTSGSYSTYTNSKTGIKFNVYSQTDSRWSGYKYSSGNTIGQVGCMITSIAVVSSAYDSSITPYTVFTSAHRNNYPWAAINSLANNSFECYSGSTTKSNIINFLNDGNVVVIKVYGKNKGGSSSFTSSQHYMALIDINDSSIYVGNGYSTSGSGAIGWHDTDKVLTSVSTADYCIPSNSLK